MVDYFSGLSSDPSMQSLQPMQQSRMAQALAQFLSSRNGMNQPSAQQTAPPPQTNQPQNTGNVGPELQKFMQSLYGNQGNSQGDGSDYQMSAPSQMGTNSQQGMPGMSGMQGQQGSGDMNSLMTALRQRESGGNYGVTNSLGYSGAYQFGPQALEQVGLLKPGASKLGMLGMDNPANWTIPGGKEAFMSNPAIQDRAMQSLMQNNKQQLTDMGLITPQSSPQEINGMLAAAHLAGPAGVRKMMMGNSPRDAYGTSASSYYNLGYGA